METCSDTLFFPLKGAMLFDPVAQEGFTNNLAAIPTMATAPYWRLPPTD